MVEISKIVKAVKNPVYGIIQICIHAYIYIHIEKSLQDPVVISRTHYKRF